jgi:hypothetical protein
MTLPLILSRIVARTGVAIWRHRLAWGAAAVIAGALAVYGSSYAGPSVVNGDCADTTMLAVTQVNDDLAHAAYACLGPAMRQTSEAQFVASLHQRDMPRGKLNRIAEQGTPDGGRIVFFTVEGQGSAVGYIVYLDARGKVTKVE